MFHSPPNTFKNQKVCLIFVYQWPTVGFTWDFTSLLYWPVIIGSHLEDEDGESDLIFYVLLRGVDKFYEEFSRYPGGDNDQVEPDVQLLKVSVGVSSLCNFFFILHVVCVVCLFFFYDYFLGCNLQISSWMGIDIERQGRFYPWNVSLTIGIHYFFL